MFFKNYPHQVLQELFQSITLMFKSTRRVALYCRLGMVGRCYTKQHQYFGRVHIEVLMKTWAKCLSEAFDWAIFRPTQDFPICLKISYVFPGVGSRYFCSAPTDDTLLGLAAPWPPVGDPTEINKRNRSDRRHAQHLPSWQGEQEQPIQFGIFPYIFHLRGDTVHQQHMFLACG